MDDSTAILTLCLILLIACLAGMVYLAWDAIECSAAFLAALVSDWWRARRSPPAPFRAPCGHQCPYHPPAPRPHTQRAARVGYEGRRPGSTESYGAPSWAPSDAAWRRDLELTR